jgi:hypothetical protein
MLKRSNGTPIKLFSVDFCDLKSMSLKFGNDVFITLEIPRYIYPFENSTFRCYSVHLLQRPLITHIPYCCRGSNFAKVIENCWENSNSTL